MLERWNNYVNNFRSCNWNNDSMVYDCNKTRAKRP